MSTWFSTNEAFIQTALVVTLLALSYQVAIRAGVSSFGGVGFYAIGAYTTAILVKDGWNFLLAILVSLVGCAVIGVLLGLVLGRLRQLYLAMATFAFVLLVQILARSWDSVTGGALGIFAIPVKVTTGALAIVVVVVMVGLWLWERGRTGRALETLRIDPDLAPSLGIDTRRYRLVVFMLSSLLGGLAGAMYALMFNALTPDQVGFLQLVTALEVLVIGGLASAVGPLVGAIIFTWLPKWFSFMNDWRPLVLGCVVVLLVVYFPEGIMGVVARVRRWLVSQPWQRRPGSSSSGSSSSGSTSGGSGVSEPETVSS